MNKPTTLIILVIIGLLLVAAGWFLGANVFPQKPLITNAPATQNASPNQNSAVVQMLNSPVVVSITAFGKISNISGKNVTVGLNNQNLTVKMSDTAKTLKLTAPAGKAPVQETINFSDLKVGDTVNINLKITKDGNMEGISILVLPS